MNNTALAGPRICYRTIAVIEAITWAGLLIGMFLKYVTRTTELGVTIFGMLHGVAFVAFCVATVIVGIDQRWRALRIVLGLLSSIPPFTTLLFDWLVERAGGLADSWRLATDPPQNAAELTVGWLVRHPQRGALIALITVSFFTAVALLIGQSIKLAD